MPPIDKIGSKLDLNKLFLDITLDDSVGMYGYMAKRSRTYADALQNRGLKGPINRILVQQRTLMGDFFDYSGNQTEEGKKGLPEMLMHFDLMPKATIKDVINVLLESISTITR